MAHINFYERLEYCKKLAKKKVITRQDIVEGAKLFGCTFGSFAYSLGHAINGGLPVYSNKTKKAKILSRDNYTCQYCLTQTTKLVPDHVVPYIKGGPALEYNLVACCYSCNGLKRNKVRVPQNIELLKSLNPEWAEKIIKMAEGNVVNEKKERRYHKQER